MGYFRVSLLYRFRGLELPVPSRHRIIEMKMCRTIAEDMSSILVLDVLIQYYSDIR